MRFYSYFGSILYFFWYFGIAFIGIHLLEDVVVPKRTKFFLLAPSGLLVPLPSDAACQLNVFWHDCDPLRMDGTKVGVLKEAHQISLRGLL